MDGKCAQPSGNSTVNAIESSRGSSVPSVPGPNGVIVIVSSAEGFGLGDGDCTVVGAGVGCPPTPLPPGSRL